MAKSYQELMDRAFAGYYERFRSLNAISKENAVSIEELFPEGATGIDAKQMHKMLSMDIVKRAGATRYWLDEKRAANEKAVLLQRILIVVIAVVLGVGYAMLRKMGILNF